jgi:hypothetical protein
MGLDSRFDPVECPDEGCGGKEVAAKSVVARGDAPPVFDAREVVFDRVARPTSWPVSAWLSRRDHPSDRGNYLLIPDTRKPGLSDVFRERAGREQFGVRID